MKKQSKFYLVDWSISFSGSNSSGFNSVLQVIKTNDIEKEEKEFDEYLKNETPDIDEYENEDDIEFPASYNIKEISKTEYNILKKYVFNCTPGIQQY